MPGANKIKELLIELGISDGQSIVPYFPKVRDRDDVSVLKCMKSGVIFLDRTDHMDITHYNEKEAFRYFGTKEQDRRAALASGVEDAERRSEQLKYNIANKKWIDIGTGVGGILDILSPLAADTVAVEPQQKARNNLVNLGYKVYSSIDEVRENNFDVATLFHVLEHFTDPLQTLRSIREKMAKGGKIIVEVPHARDFLISFIENDPFKSFTFWSEHLLLHTRESLSIFLKAAGFSSVVIKNFQRYPLANHLHWLSRGKPGGHVQWPQLRTKELDQSYTNMLASLDQTDTLIAFAENV